MTLPNLRENPSEGPVRAEDSFDGSRTGENCFGRRRYRLAKQRTYQPGPTRGAGLPPAVGVHARENGYQKSNAKSECAPSTAVTKIIRFFFDVTLDWLWKSRPTTGRSLRNGTLSLVVLTDEEIRPPSTTVCPLDFWIGRIALWRLYVLRSKFARHLKRSDSERKRCFLIDINLLLLISLINIMIYYIFIFSIDANLLSLISLINIKIYLKLEIFP